MPSDAIPRSFFRRDLHAFGDLDPFVDALVMRDHHVAARPDAKLAHHRRMRPPKDFDNLAVSAPIVLDTRDPSHYTICVHGALGGIAADVDVTAKTLDRTIRNYEAVAVAMHIEPADGVFAAEARCNELAGADFDQVATLGQLVERRF
jgi:hypothetical protein